MSDTQTLPDCLFCKLANSPDGLIWQNDEFAAFKDIHPKERVHILIVPKDHVNSLDEATPELSGSLLEATRQVAAEQGVTGAYRVAINVGRKGGQEVDHLHLHLMAP
ncbi:HIT domain-containing protein [Patescibacteria group bacterium]|nr:MAG: HIT domain-containing protein [Patescibacteria group bacterium]